MLRRRNPQINDEFNQKGPIMRKALPFGGTFMPCGFWLWWWWTYRLFFPVDDIWSGCLVAVVVVNTITCLLVIIIRLVWPPYFIRVIDEQAAWQNSSHLSISSIKYHTLPKLLTATVYNEINRYFCIFQSPRILNSHNYHNMISMISTGYRYKLNLLELFTWPCD